MDLALVKQQLGNFADFVDSFGKFVENFPKAVEKLHLLYETFSSSKS